MPRHSFRYSPIPIPPSDPSVTALYLRAQLVCPATGLSISCLVWPDPGADHCVFPLSFARAIGLDPLNMKMQMTGGVGNTANATYYGNVRVNILLAPNSLPLSFTVLAGFTAGIEAQGLGLLGQLGFFENFGVSFNHSNKVFHIDT